MANTSEVQREGEREQFESTLIGPLNKAVNMLTSGAAHSGPGWSYDPRLNLALGPGRAPASVCAMIAEVKSLSTERLAEAYKRFGRQWWRDWCREKSALHPHVFGQLLDTPTRGIKRAHETTAPPTSRKKTASDAIDVADLAETISIAYNGTTHALRMNKAESMYQFDVILECFARLASGESGYSAQIERLRNKIASGSMPDGSLMDAFQHRITHG